MITYKYQESPDCAAPASKMNLQTDDVVAFECRPPHLLNSECRRRRIKMVDIKTHWYSAESHRAGSETSFIIPALDIKVRGLPLIGNRLTLGNRMC